MRDGKNRFGVVTLLGALGLALLFNACGKTEAPEGTPAQEATPAAAPEATATPADSSSVQESSNPCPNPPPCNSGQNCDNYPYKATDCWTTPYGPARADVIVATNAAGAVESPNMLLCDGNTYALCFFSGPPTPTGNGKTSALPCELSGDMANCTCKAFTSKANFVDINGILNRGAYFETVELCGQDGSKCKNIVNCGPGGDLPGCKTHPTAPVCKYVKDQSPTNPEGSLMPKADLISTFSFQMSGNNGPYELGSVPCTGRYAGCMTAACFYGPTHTSPTQDGEQVQCLCPTYEGTFQVGQKGQSCDIPDQNGKTYVWSASNTVQATQ